MHKLAKKQMISFANKNLNYMNFWFNLNCTIREFNKNISEILDKKLFYFWNRKATIFNIIDNVIKNKSNPTEEAIFWHIMSNFNNRNFFRHLYEFHDKSAIWLIKFLDFQPLPSPID